MKKSVNYNAIAEKAYNQFATRALGVSSLSTELAGAFGRSSSGRAILGALGLTACDGLTQKAVYNAIKKRYPLRNTDGKMCTHSAVVGGVFSPSVVSVVSVAFIATLLEGGPRVELPPFYVRKGGAVYGVASAYVSEGVNLDSEARRLKGVRNTAEEDLRSAEVTHSRAVAGGASDIEVQMALKSVGVASGNCAVAIKNYDGAVAEFEGWKGGLSAFVK